MQPVLAIYPTEDPVADWEMVASLLDSSEYLPNLEVQVSVASSVLLESDSPPTRRWFRGRIGHSWNLLQCSILC